MHGQVTGDGKPLSAFVNQDRLWRRHMEMAKIGALSRGGVNRPALSLEDAQAQIQMIDWAKELNFECFTDAIGNLFVRRNGTDPSAPAVIAGSHLDSQPSGGKFDGTSGVLAGFEVMETMEEQGLVTKRPIEVVSWTNEEGCRFALGTMGSHVFANPGSLDVYTAQKDAAGISVAQALAEVKKALPKLPERPLGRPVDSYIEMHIEGGRVLELAEKVIGIVTGIQGSRKFRVDVVGEEGHAGSTPGRLRKDALFAAVDMISELRKLMYDPKDIVCFTIGQLEVKPGAGAVVPGEVNFLIDFRHPDEEVLTRLGDQIDPICQSKAGPCKVTVTHTKRNPCTNFEGLVVDEIVAATKRLGLPHMFLPSGGGHDGRWLAPLCKAGMIFVPCEMGITHNEAEYAKPEDLTAGTRVMADVIARLANR